MGRALSANGKLLAFVASLALSAALIYAQTVQTPHTAPPIPVAAPAAQAAAIAPNPLPPPPPGVPSAESLAANAPVVSAATPFELPPGVAPEGGLQVNTIRAARAISVMFPEIKTIGGYRQDPLPWHPNGLAIDVMIPDHNSEAGIALGNQIAGYALANAKRWGVIHVIWRQGFYPAEQAPSWTADYGNETANHMDHVHIATNGGGYPTGNEKYFI